MRPMISTVSMAAADPNGLVEAVIVNGAAVLDGALVNAAGVGIFATPRHINITGVAATDPVNFTIVGTDRHGIPITEVLLGPDGAVSVSGVFNFKTIISITSAATTTDTVAIGEADEAEGPWVPLDHYQTPFNVSLGVVYESGADLTCAVQHTFDKVQGINTGPGPGFQENDATPFDHETLTALTANDDGNIAYPAAAVRLEVTSHTAAGVALHVTQAGQ